MTSITITIVLIDNMNLMENAYREGGGMTQYPFAIEVLAIPYKASSVYDYDTDTPINRSSQFIGAINYSLSPRVLHFACTHITYRAAGLFA